MQNETKQLSLETKPAQPVTGQLRKETIVTIEAIPEDVLDIELYKGMEHLGVTDDEEEGRANEAIHEIGEKIKDIESRMDEVYGPIEKHIKKMKKGVTDRALKPLRAIHKALREAVGDYMTMKERKRQADERKAKEEAAAKKRAEAEKIAEVAAETNDEKILDIAVKKEVQAEKIVSAAPTPRPLSVSPSGHKTGSQKYWEPVIEDESKIPDEYWIIDMMKINMRARQYGANPVEIPGVRFDEKLRPVSR